MKPMSETDARNRAELEKLKRKPVDPKSLRGRLAVRLSAVIEKFDLYEFQMRAEAAKQNMTVRQLLAAVLTEAVLEIVDGGLS